MHIKTALIAALCALPLCAQTPHDPDVARAESQLAHVRLLVEQGVAPEAALASAQQAVSNAQEDAFLRQTLYGKDVTEEQAAQMVALTERRLARRQQEVTAQQQLVDEGVVSRLSLTPVLEKLDLARKENDYALSRSKLIQDMAEMARTEAAFQSKIDSGITEFGGLAERFDGDGVFTNKDFRKVTQAFVREFAKNLPISANGETALHRALGFDHRGRVDVAINPDSTEGVWLREYLTANHLPYFAFRAAMHGKATGPHIHMGPMSTRLAHNAMSRAG
jgi:hypothetical protein